MGYKPTLLAMRTPPRNLLNEHLRATGRRLTALACGLIICPVALAGTDTFGATGLGNQITQVANAMSGTIATSIFLVVLIVVGAMWWIQRSEKAGQMLGKVLIGAFIIFAAPQIHKWITGITGAGSITF